jgi:tetratricopeptide (TPR) repeat protein
MSRMMDNLARILEEEKSASPAKKATLFVVRDTIAPSAQSSRVSAPNKRVILVWAAAALLIGGLGLAIFRDFTWPGARSGSAPAPVAMTPAVMENDKSVALLRSGQFAQAESALRELLKRQPALRAARLNHGFALKALGRLAEAEQAYKIILRSAPADAVALNNLGALYLKAGRGPEAEAVLRQAVAADPAYSDAQLNLAAAYEQEREWAMAASSFEKVMASDIEMGADPRIRERLRRLRSLAAAASGPKEKF